MLPTYPSWRTRILGFAFLAALVALTSCSEGVFEPVPTRSPTDPVVPPAPLFDHIPDPAISCPFVGAGEVDLTGALSCARFDGSFVEQSLIGVTGTGVFAPFVRIQASPTEKGHNTSARPLLNDENSSPNWTRSLNLAHVPQIDVGDGTIRREVRLDINESSSTSLLSLDVIKVFVSGNDDELFSTSAGPAGATLVWDLDDGSDRYIALDYNNAPGSGKGDMFLYIPDIDFGAGSECDYNGGVQAPPAACDVWVYLWTEAGGVYNSDDGFEEWSVRISVDVDAEKTAVASFDREIDWEVTKTASPDWSLFNGDAGQSTYNVSAEAVGTNDSNHQVTGTATLTNNSGFNLDLRMITDEIAKTGVEPFAPETMECIRDRGNAVIEVGVLLSGGDRNFNSGDVISCTYSHASFPDVDMSGEWTNTLVATLVKAGQGQAEDTEFNVVAGATFEFTDAVANIINGTVTVEDLYGEETTTLGTATYPGTTTFPAYERTFACPDDAGPHTNTARIIGEDDEVLDTDDATVTVTCYDIGVSKTADESYTREWDWDIEKSADQTSFEVGINDFVTVNYSVRVWVTGYDDSGWAVSGDIVFTNPNPALDATINSVADVISIIDGDDITATVTCPGTAPYIVPKNDGTDDGTLTCTYSATLPDAADRTNTATGVQQHHLYNPDGTVEALRPTSDHSYDADVIFGDPTTVLDDCATVTDENDAFGGPYDVCLDSTDPETTEYTYDYSVLFGDFETCEQQTYHNVADVTEDDTGDYHSDDVTVTIDVICQGCTLTQGYWKTHSEYGPAPYDDTWAQLDDGADTPFFSSGQTWYEVFHTSPNGNAYYILAHQYMAAVLNTLNGASIWNGAQDALNEATGLFETYTPEQIAALSGDDLLRQQFIDLAGTLDDYNTGETGPGHCDDAEPVVLPPPGE